MAQIRWSWLVLAGVVVLGGTACPPAEPPADLKSAATETSAVPSEKLELPPTPLPGGPRPRIEAAIQNVRDRDLLTTNGFWTVFHGILGLGPGVLLHNRETGQRFNAVQYICDGGELRGLQFIPTKWGLDVQIGPTFVGQGHQDQFVAEMGQWGMPADQQFLVFGKPYTFMDFVRHAQMRARVTSDQELSWTLPLLAQYVGTDIAWRNGHGEQLHLTDLVKYELEAPVETAACGGTHRLFGLTWAYHLHLQRGGKSEGVWQQVAEHTAKYRDLARKYQNPDGCFSTSYFRGPGNDANKQLRIGTTGHILEWLALALTDAELKEPWMQDAATALSMLILDLQGAPIESGALYHAVHGLLMYYARVYDRTTLGPPELLIPLPPDPAYGQAAAARPH